MLVAVLLLPITLIRLLVDFPGREYSLFTEALSWVEALPTLLSVTLFHLAKVLVVLFTYRFSTISSLERTISHIALLSYLYLLFILSEVLEQNTSSGY